MSIALELPPEIAALGMLAGVLAEDGDGVALRPEWFENPTAADAPSLANADQRLDSLTALIEASLPPAGKGGPEVFPGARWFAIPEPFETTPTPFCLVVPAKGATSGQLGLGVLYETQDADVIVAAYGYLPLVEYDEKGAKMIAVSAATPTRIGVSAGTKDGSGFTVAQGTGEKVTFAAMSMAAYLYLDPAAYSQSPPPSLFSLVFEDIDGTGSNESYHSLADLLNPEIDARITAVILAASGWLDTFVGFAPMTVADLLVAGRFLEADKQGRYCFSLQNIEGEKAEDIVLSFVFGVLDGLSDGDFPVAAIELPGGGLFFTARQNPDGTTDYGLRLVLDVGLSEGTGGSPAVDLVLGEWLRDETDETSWVERSLGSSAGEIAEPGLSIYLVRQGPLPDDVSFTPSFALASAGLNLRNGDPSKSLLEVGGVTLGGVEVRAYLDEGEDWKFGAAARLDDVGIPLGPNFDAATASTKTNPVAQNLVAGGSDGGGERQPVNPALSLSAAWVEGGALAFQLYDATGGPAQQVWLPVQRSLGPLSVKRLGAGWVQTGHQLSLLLDGGVEVGELSIDLTGLSVGIPVTSPTEFSQYDLDLQGLGITFVAGEVELSAAFVKVPPDPPSRTYAEYDGEAVLSAGTFTIAAIGSYAHAVESGDGYTSLFVFGALDADLGGPGFFYVTGLAAGFGYNRDLLLPDAGGVATFPLVEAAGDPAAMGATKNEDGSWAMPDPAAALAHLDRFVPPRRGSYWLAAGVRFTSYDLIHSEALLVVEFGNELEVALLGRSQISLPAPPDPGSDAPAPYAYAELGLEVKLLPAVGVFSATAVLTPNSFVLDPACKLTGGFAFYVWFGSNEHAGQFVLTLGGYHPAFQPPSYYPTVPRLGFNWPMSSDVTVSGEAYFALTPSAVMAGGALSVVFASGDLRAWLTAHMDALVEWAPLHYELEIAISIGVSYRLHLLFVTVNLSVELGAELEIWGPPTGGSARIHWVVISFTVGFGADREGAPPPLEWTNSTGTGFAQTLLPSTEPAPSALAAAAPTAATPSGIFTVALTGGLVSSFEDGAATVYVVRPADFSFSAMSAIPVTAIELEAADDAEAEILQATAESPAGADYYVGIRPMGTMLSSSFLKLQIKDDEQGEILAMAARFDFRPALVGVPAAKWGKPLAPGTEPAMNELLEGRLLGVQDIAPKAPQLTPSGESALSMDVEETFTYDVVDAAGADRLPLQVGAAPPEQPPAVDPAAPFETVKATLMSPAVARARSDVFQALESLGIDAGTDGRLTAFAAEPDAFLTANPLLAPLA